jgi:hypothetical protein
MAHLAAGSLVSDGTGLEVFCAIEGRLYVLLSGLLQEHLRGRINGFQVFSHDVFKTPFLKGDKNTPVFMNRGILYKIRDKNATESYNTGLLPIKLMM